MKRIIRYAAALFGILLLLAAAFIAVLHFHRPGLDAYAAHHYSGSPPPPGTPALTAAWFGTTAVLISDGTHALFVDPFFTRPEGWLNLLLNREISPDRVLIERWLRRAGVSRLDAVLVSHSHYDHSMDAGVVADLTGAMLLGSSSTANVGRGAGLPESRLRAVTSGVPARVGTFTVTFIESRHAGATGGTPTGDIMQPLAPPARYLDYRQGGTWSILIEHPLGTVLHHGSAGFVPGALAGRGADVVFLGIALREDLDEYLTHTVDAVGARRVIPTHWDDFTRPLDQPLVPGPVGVRLDKFFAEMNHLRPDVRVQTLRLAEPVVLFQAYGTGK